MPISTGYRPVILREEKVGYRSARPYYNVLYRDYRKSASGYGGTSASFYKEYYQTLAHSYVTSADFNSPYVVPVYNKAYARLISKAKDVTAELGTALYERRKTADMVSDRVTQLYKVFRAVRRGRFGEANELLNIPSGFRPKARGFGGAVLEYSFGWAPTVSDIYNACKVLTDGVPLHWVKARASGPLSVPGERSGSDYGTRYSGGVTGTVSVTVGCRLTITNHNLWLANQLGLINPVSIAWEVIPFSFLVDYFINVSDVINSWTDFFGVSQGDVYRQLMMVGSSQQYQEMGFNPPDRWPVEGKNLQYGTWTGSSYRFIRFGDLPGPSLRFTAPRISLTRASTSIALLLQQLKGK